LDFGYHSLDRTSLDGNTDSPRTLHTVEENIHEGQDSSSRDETQSIERMSGKNISGSSYSCTLSTISLSGNLPLNKSRTIT